MIIEAPDLRRFPTIQASVGDWAYYITAVPFYEIARRVRPAAEIVTTPNMNEWIQRQVMPRRRRQIADYLIESPQHFFPSIVVGVYGGEPRWYEIDVPTNSLFDTPGLDDRFRYSLGILELDGTETLYAVDGQHRIAGIEEALNRLRARGNDAAYHRLANEDLTVIFVSADIAKRENLQRLRRLFATLNKQAKRVSDAELVALDEDHPAAIVTRWLATDYEGLRPQARTGGEEMGLIQMGTRNEIRPSNKHSVTTILTLFTVIRKVFAQELKEDRKTSKGNRPDEPFLQSLYGQCVELWDVLGNAVPELGMVLGSDPRDEEAGNYRRLGGGHVLFRPAGQQVFAGALGVLRARGRSTREGVSLLARAPMEIADIPWVRVLWDADQRRMVPQNRVLAEAIFLRLVGQPPRTPGYDLERKWAELHPDTPLPNTLG